MAKDLVAAKANLPAHLQKYQGAESSKEFAGGVMTGFPVISYRGKTWRVKEGGEEQVYVDDDDEAIQSIELVLLRSHEQLSKTYYDKKYTEGDNAKPRCWSANGVRPDPQVPNPVNSKCQTCPKNVWGSRVSDEGKKMKACQDVRRMAVVFTHELEAVAAGEKKLEEVPVMLLRCPPATLGPLKKYVVEKLAPKGVEVFMVSTRIGFDKDASYPKLTFKAKQFLGEDEFSYAEELRDSDVVKRILDESSEYADEGTTDDEGEAESSDSNTNSEAPESAPSETSNSEEEHYDDDDDDIPAAPPKRAASVEAEGIDDDGEGVEDDDDDDDIPLPTPKKTEKKAATKKKSSKKKKAAKPKEEADAVEDSSPPVGDEAIGELLGSLLDSD